MAKKKQVAVIAPVAEKVTEQFDMQVQLVLSGPKSSLEELQRLIRTDETAHYICFDRLIGLPSFVQAGLPVDHPRSELRWAVLTRNTRQSDARLTTYTVSESDDRFVMTLTFGMVAEVLKVDRAERETAFRFLEELVFYFNDLSIMGGWRMVTEAGDMIYGLASVPGLIQKQTAKHEAAGQELFNRKALGGIVNA